MTNKNIQCNVPKIGTKNSSLQPLVLFRLFHYIQIASYLLPGLNLEHASLLGQGLVQVEGVEEQVGLVTHALLETLALGLLVVVGEDGLVLGVGALVDDNAGALAGGQAADVGETLLGDDNVEIVLGLVDVGAHGDNTRNTVGVGLGRSAGGSVHDGVLGVAEEIG